MWRPASLNYLVPAVLTAVLRPKVFEVVKVSGDGDCLFHALGFAHKHDGGALRIEVADFMEHHAYAQPGFQETWLREAAKLRNNRGGGHTVITAYSLMKNTRVMLHTKKEDEEQVVVEEVSHGAV